MTKSQLKPGDYVKFDIVIGSNTVQGKGQVTSIRAGGPMIQPSKPLPMGARLENIVKV